MKNLQDYTGQLFGRLRCIKRIEGAGDTKWLCECACYKGNFLEVKLSSLLNPHGKRSCGCLKKDYKKRNALFLANKFRNFNKILENLPNDKESLVYVEKQKEPG